MRPLVALISLVLLGCPRFPEDGLYKCDPAHPVAGDCGPVPQVAECSNQFCRVYTAPAGVRLRGIGGSPGVFAVVGTDGFFAESDGGAFTTSTLEGGNLVGVAWRLDGTAVVATAGGQILRRAPGGTRWTSGIVAGGGTYLTVFERSGEIWVGRAAAAGPLALHADGGIEEVNTGYLGDYSDIGGVDATAFLQTDTVSTNAAYVHLSSGGAFGGYSWAPGQIEAVYLRQDAPQRSLVIAGPNGFLSMMSDHETPVTPPSPDAHFRDIFGNTATEFWVVGNGGLVLRYAESTWSTLPFDFQEDLVAGWQRGPNDVSILGERSVFHWTGP